MGPHATLLALALAACGALFVAIAGQSSIAGAVAGMAVATASILGLGPGALAPLALFVLGGGALTRMGAARKRALAMAEPNEGRRGLRNVAAKLALPALVAVVAGATGSANVLSLAFATALAGAMADTAGTELGPLGGGAAFGFGGAGIVRLEHGTAGAVSAAGLAATMGGGAAVAAAALAAGVIPGIVAALLVAFGGFAAALLESLVAGTPFGRGIGHFGRNLFVSAVATALGLGVGLSGLGNS
jgi:uncharacterized membrane protein